jgi:hypothetical protein
MGYREARELARIRTDLRDRLMSQRYEGAPAVLRRFDEIAGIEPDLRSEYERWRMRFQLLSAWA